MRIVASLLAAAALAVAVPAVAQTPVERVRRCGDRWEGESPLVGTVTDVESGRPLYAVLIIDDYPLGSTDETGCYSVTPADEIVGGHRRVQVQVHRYQAVDTVLEIRREATDTVHFALRPVAPACCRLEGEWSIRLTLDPGPESSRLRPRAKEVEGTIVFSPRLPPPPRPWLREREPSPVEQGRFQVDLGTFFGGPYARDVSTTIFAPRTGDFLQQVEGEVLADDSVMMVMIPGMSHGGLSLDGTLRGDTVRGTWVQNAYCCGARGRFAMHRVPASPAGDSLVARGQRSMQAAIEASERGERARKLRVGTLRLRVLDEGTGQYVAVDFAARGHASNPGGGTTSISYSSGAGGWGREHVFEPGRYDLLVYTFPCRGEEQMGDGLSDDAVPLATVTIEPGKRVDQDIRVDLCSLKRYEPESR
jgi:hypothetical protein